MLRDLYLSDDGSRVAYLAVSREGYVLRTVDVNTRAVREWTRAAAGLAATPFLRGWLPNDAGIFLTRRTEFYDDRTWDIDVLVVPPKVNVNSVAELLQLARAKPRQLNCASGGAGTTAHLGCEMLKSMGRIDIVHVPYKGVAQATVDLLGGQVQLSFTVMHAGLPHARAGRLRALAVSGSKRSIAVPELPTVSEAGVPGFAFDSWNGVHVPAGTPKSVIGKLNTGLVKAVQLPDVQKRMLDLGLEPVGSTPEAFAALIRTDIARWARVVKDAGVRTE